MESYMVPNCLAISGVTNSCCWCRVVTCFLASLSPVLLGKVSLWHFSMHHKMLLLEKNEFTPDQCLPIFILRKARKAAFSLMKH